MASDWCPGAIVISSSHDGGSMVGGPPRFTIHSYEADPHKVSATAGAHSLINAGHEVHLCFNPLTGDYAQILPASRAGRGLVNLAGGVETNRMGSCNIQVEVIAFAADPFTDYMTADGWASWGIIMDWVASHGVARTWPSGPPPVYPPGTDERSVDKWTNYSGLFGHSQVPENTHGDPGAVDAHRLCTAGGDMPLTTADADLVVSRLLAAKIPNRASDVVGATETCADAWSWARRHAYMATTGEGSGGVALTQSIAEIQAELDQIVATGGAVDVAKLAAALIAAGVGHLSPEDLAAVGEAVADEEARRLGA